MKYSTDSFERYTIIRHKNFILSNESMRTKTLLYVELQISQKIIAEYSQALCEASAFKEKKTVESIDTMCIEYVMVKMKSNNY